MAREGRERGGEAGGARGGSARGGGPPLILGVDPGTRRVGYALLEAGPRPRARGYGVIRLRPEVGIPRRLALIYRSLLSIVRRHQPDVVAVERVFHGKNFQSILKVGEARGVALLVGAQEGLEVVEYTPAMVKKSVTGRGGATKVQVQRMVTRLLCLKEPPEPLDASDALAIALCHVRHMTRPTVPGGRGGTETPLQALIQSLKKSRKSGKGRSDGAAGGLDALLARARAGRAARPAQAVSRRKERMESRKLGGAAAAGSAGGVMTQSELKGLKLIGRGKVRDIYDLGEHILVVASDRLSAFDVVLPDGIPDKGRVLTRLSAFWFGLLGGPHHLVTADVGRMPREVQAHAAALQDRAMLVKRLEIFPIECVVRGYLSGSGWAEYKERGSVCGVKLPKGLVESDRLPEPIFTPTTKAAAGHDLPMTFEEVVKAVGEARAKELRDRTIEVYRKAADYARTKGIIICDTKFEWGIPVGSPKGDPKAAPAVLADEVLTPDSSRFWPAAQYSPGKGQPSFDKQYVRDYLLSLKWDKQPPGPKLPAEVIERTAAKYREIYGLLTGKKWA